MLKNKIILLLIVILFLLIGVFIFLFAKYRLIENKPLPVESVPSRIIPSRGTEPIVKSYLSDEDSFIYDIKGTINDNFIINKDGFLEGNFSIEGDPLERLIKITTGAPNGTAFIGKYENPDLTGSVTWSVYDSSEVVTMLKKGSRAVVRIDLGTGMKKQAPKDVKAKEDFLDALILEFQNQSFKKDSLKSIDFYAVRMGVYGEIER